MINSNGQHILLCEKPPLREDKVRCVKYIDIYTERVLQWVNETISAGGKYLVTAGRRQETAFS